MAGRSSNPRERGRRPALVYLASDSEEVPAMPTLVSSGHSALATVHKGRRGYTILAHQDGPLVMVLLLAEPGGRWSPELAGGNAQCGALRQMGEQTRGHSDTVAARPAVVGLAIVKGWHAVHRQATHDHTYALVQASEAFHRRRTGARYLEHEVVAAAQFRCGHPAVDELANVRGPLTLGSAKVCPF